MADTKITALTAITTVDPAVDVLPIVDVSDTTMAASGTTKKITSNQILGAGGTATLASATITGDLTVDTSTLKVDSANDRVGVGTASPAQFVHLSKSSTSTALTAPPVGGASLRIQNTSSTNNNFGSVEFYNANGLFGGSVNCQFTNQATPTNDLVFVTRGSSGGLEHYRIAADGVCTWSEVGGVAGTAMTLNSTGLGVGVTPSAWQSSVKAVQLGGAALSSFSTYVGFLTSNAYNDGAWKFVSAQGASRYEINANVHSWHVSTNSPSIGGAITFSQAMTLDASGNLLVGTTSAIASGTSIQNLGSARQVLTLKGNDQTSYTLGVWSAATTGDNLFSYFGTETSLSVRGSIDYNRAGGLVRYNTTSDYRAKDIIGPVSNSGSLIDSLKVYIGKMKGATIERPMLIAHEAQGVAPYAVTGTKDEVDADGNPKYQQMDVSSLVPLLIAEIQSLRARVEALEA